MSITSALIYWISCADKIIDLSDTLLGIFSFVGVTSITIGVCVYYLPDQAESTLKHIRRLFKYWLIFPAISLFFALVSTFTPSSKTLCAMYVIPAVANSQSIQEIGSEIINLSKEWLKELSPKNISKSDNTDK